MARRAKPSNGKADAKRPPARKAPKGDRARVRDLEMRLAEALKREAEALTQLQTSHRERAEAQEHQFATAEILRVIAASPMDEQPVFDAIVSSAQRLLHAHSAALRRVVGGELVAVAFTTTTLDGQPLPPPRVVHSMEESFPGGVAARDRVPIVVADMEADPRILAAWQPEDKVWRARGYRSMLSVPLVRESNAIGVINVTRRERGGFTDDEIALLKTFADQAVIAIENVRLFSELQASNGELTTALDKQTATSDILRVISRSQTDVQPVFEAIVQSAVRLLHGYHGAVIRVGGDRLERVATTGAAGAEVPAWRNVQRPLHGESVHAQAIRARAPLNFADVLTDPRVLEELRDIARAIGYRSLAVVPLLRHDEALGTIAVTRREHGGFTDDDIALLKTFADQAVIAIENVRLFTELQDKNRALTVAHAQVTESLEQQVATGEILKVISQSPTDVQSVFDTIARSVVRLCGGVLGGLYRFDGELIHQAAHYNYNPEGVEAARRSFPALPTRALVVGRTILDRAVVHILDVELDAEYRQTIAQALHVRSILSVPMLRDGMPIGAIAVARAEAGRFSDSQIELLKTFADQAVIAIENVRLFNELEAANRSLKAASQHKSEFLANMSHELRTPLNAVIGFSEVLNERMFGDLNDKQADYLKDIHASGQHLLSLINDILDLSKIEAGRMELELSDFDLSAALDNALTLVRERAGRRGITLGLTVDERLGRINADERKFRQVVLNLLSNAIKFTPEGGRIDVRAALVHGTVEIAVTDTGIGIAPEDHEAVFEEFKQVGKADQKAQGTGLGLALCRKFVELHGGRIWVKSHEGQGSTFTFTFPIRQDATT